MMIKAWKLFDSVFLLWAVNIFLAVTKWLAEVTSGVVNIDKSLHYFPLYLLAPLPYFLSIV